MTGLPLARPGSYLANVAEHLALAQRRQRVSTFTSAMVLISGIVAAAGGAAGSDVGLTMAVLVLPFGLLLIGLTLVQARRLRSKPLPSGLTPPVHWVLDTDRGARIFAISACLVLIPLIGFIVIGASPTLRSGALIATALMLITAVGASLTALTARIDPMALLADRLDGDPRAGQELDIVRQGLQRAQGSMPFA